MGVSDTPPNTVTRHDILKTVALLLMVIDHVGFFLFPDEPAFRAIGRASAPIWLFLVGYNRKSTIDISLLGAMLGMLVIVPTLTGNWLPLNILVSIILARLALPYFPRLMQPFGGFGQGTLPGMQVLALGMLLYPTHLLWEYGAYVFLFAALGWWQREAEDISSPYAQQKNGPLVFGAIIVVLYVLHYHVFMEFTPAQATLMLLAVMPVFVSLLRFHGGIYGAAVPALPARILRFCGRNSLLLYVAHYILLGMLHFFVI